MLGCSQTDNHPQEDLVKFAYRPNMNIEIFKNPFYILSTCLRVLRNLAS
jgi:hypothetical protein